MTRDACSRHFSGRAVTLHAIRFHRHKNVPRFATLHGVMAIVTLGAGVFYVIEIGTNDPAVDQDRFCDRRGAHVGRHHFMAIATTGKRRARFRRGALLRLVRIGCEENAPDQFVIRAKLIPQSLALLFNERTDLAGSQTLLPREVFVLRRERSQKSKHRGRIAMRQRQFRIIQIELERMTSLTIGRESDAPHEASFRVRFVAVTAIELRALLVDRRNIDCEVPLMIESQRVRVAHFGISRLLHIQLEFGMVRPEIVKRPGETARRARQFKDDLLRGMCVPMKKRRLDLRPFMRGRFHHPGIAVT